MLLSQQLLAPNGTSGLRAVVWRDWVPQIPTGKEMQAVWMGGDGNQKQSCSQ